MLSAREDGEELKSIVIDYLKSRGYLTEGFVGVGPVRVEFKEETECAESMVVGVKECGNDTFSTHEIVAVKIGKGDKCEADFATAASSADAVSANKCFVAMPTHFDADDKVIAAQFGIGLWEIQGKKVKEVVRAKLMGSRVIDLPKDKSEGLRLTQKLLKLTRKDLEHLARVFCRAETAWLGFDVGGIIVEFRKESGTLDININVRAGPLRKSGFYTFKFGELAEFIVISDDDRYTFVDNVGSMFIFRKSEWRFMLRVLSKVDMCHLVFYIGTARIIFSKHPGQDGLDMEMDFNDGREGYEHHYSQKDLGTLTMKKRHKTEQK